MTNATKMTPGKMWGMRRLAGPDGRFAMLAVDQRPPIMNLTKEKRGEPQPRFDDVVAVKELLVKHLAPEATAVLLDPIWAYDRCIGLTNPRQGLLITLEDHGYRDTPGGRLSHSIEGWSPERIRRTGADGVKVLAWYRPDASPEVIAAQKAYVRDIGEACRKADICFLFELLVYPLGGDVGYAEDPAKYPELVIESVKHFAGPEYGVDIFKLESPLPAAAIPDPNSDSKDAKKVQAVFDDLGRAAGRPWVMLSAGAKAESFARVLTYAYRAGANGYLAGRAIWWDAVQVYPDLAKAGANLEHSAVPFMRSINELTHRLAKPVV
jgi:tagatose 1,6-diphosphate aldolase